MSIIEWIVTSCILLALISVIRLAFKKKLQAKVRYGMWLIVLVRLLLPVSLTGSSISVLNLFSDDVGDMLTQSFGQDIYAPANSDENGGAMQGWMAGTADGQMQGADAPYPGSPNFDTQNPDTDNAAGAAWKKALVGIWIAGMAVSGLVVLGSNLIFMRRLRRSRRLIPSREIGALEGGSDIAGRIPVYAARLVSTPCLFGLLRPAIYVRPEDRYSGKELSYILRHEYTHYRHLDHIWAFFRGLCLTVHWYNPLVWAGAFWSRQDGELACDAGVLAGMEEVERLEYGRLLIELTKGSGPYGDMLCCATTMSGGKKNLRERIGRITENPKRFLLSTAIALVLCLAAAWTTFTIAAGSNDSAGKESQNNENQNNENQNEESQENNEHQNNQNQGGESNSGAGQNETEGLISAEKLVNVMFADVTHDGVEDVILTTVQYFSEEEAALSVEELVESYTTTTIVRVYDGNSYENDSYFIDRLSWGKLALEGGRIDNMQFPSGQETREAIWERELANPHVGNGAVFLTWQDGEACLLDSFAWVGQGVGEFSYQVFSLGYAGAVQEKDSGQLSFGMDNFGGEDWETVFPVPDMLAYTEQIAPWIEGGTVVAMMDVGLEPLVSRPGQDRTVKSWEIWRGFLGEAPTGMEDLEEKLEGILQELTMDTAQQPTDANSASIPEADSRLKNLYTFAVQVSEERKLTVVLNMSQLRETYDASRLWEDHFAVDRILVYEGEELLQTIEPAAVPPVEDYLWEGLFVVSGGRIGEPDIRDLNFDGSQDFGLLTSAAFPRNVPYSYFLWDDAEERFDYGFTLFSDLEADAEKRQLIEKTHETMGEYTTVYSYTEDGVLRRISAGN